MNPVQVPVVGELMKVKSRMGSRVSRRCLLGFHTAHNPACESVVAVHGVSVKVSSGISLFADAKPYCDSRRDHNGGSEPRTIERALP
jgi:hypothetical protein